MKRLLAVVLVTCLFAFSVYAQVFLGTLIVGSGGKAEIISLESSRPQILESGQIFNLYTGYKIKILQGTATLMCSQSRKINLSASTGTHVPVTNYCY